MAHLSAPPFTTGANLPLNFVSVGRLDLSTAKTVSTDDRMRVGCGAASAAQSALFITDQSGLFSGSVRQLQGGHFYFLRPLQTHQAV